MASAEWLLRARAAAEPVLLALAAGNPADLQQVPDLLSRVTERLLALDQAGRPIADVERYAKQAARNAFRDSLRARRRQRVVGPGAGSPSESAAPLVERLVDRAARTPASLVADDDERRRHAPQIKAAWEALTPTERAVLGLRHVEGRTAVEVAAVLGYRSAAVVDSTASRARRRLRDLLPEAVVEAVLGG